jgi:hypothetical protein
MKYILARYSDSKGATLYSFRHMEFYGAWQYRWCRGAGSHHGCRTLSALLRIATGDGQANAERRACPIVLWNVKWPL